MIDLNSIFVMSGQSIVFRLIGGLVLAVLHGVTLAWLARLLGDPGPGQDGRLTLNPLAHVHPLGLIALVVARLGWIRPIDTGASALRGGLAGVLVLVVVSILVLPAFGALIWQFRPHLLALFPGSNPAIFVIGVIETTARLSIWFAVLNLVPLPPLTAGLLLSGIVPSLHRWLVGQMTLVSIVLLLVILAGWPAPVLAPIVAALEAILLR